MKIKEATRSLWRRIISFVQSVCYSKTKTRFSHADVVANSFISDEVSTDYKKSINLLDNVIRDCIYVSKAHSGIPSPSTKHFYASVLFTALLSRGVSLVVLAPHSPWSNKIIEHWDYASAAMIVRSMIEIRAAFHYLCIDHCSDDEWNCRWNLLNLHDCVSRIRLFSASRYSNDEDLEKFEKQANELRERLISNRHFAQLKNKKRLLNGQTAYLFPLEDIVEKAGLEKQTYRYLNILFSSAVHGLPMSYYRMAEQERGRGLPSPVERGYTAICLSLAASLLVGARDDLEHLFKDILAT